MQTIRVWCDRLNNGCLTWSVKLGVCALVLSIVITRTYLGTEASVASPFVYVFLICHRARLLSAWLLWQYTFLFYVFLVNAGVRCFFHLHSSALYRKGTSAYQMQTRLLPSASYLILSLCNVWCQLISAIHWHHCEFSPCVGRWGVSCNTCRPKLS